HRHRATFRRDQGRRPPDTEHDPIRKGHTGEPGPPRPRQGRAQPGDLAVGWGLLVRRLEEKAPGRVEKINPAFTSQRCSACGQVDGRSRESQAVFRCTACGYACHADVNAARNIAAGHAVTARGGCRDAGPANREPQLLASLTGREWLESPTFSSGWGRMSRTWILRLRPRCWSRTTCPTGRSDSMAAARTSARCPCSARSPSGPGVAGLDTSRASKLPDPRGRRTSAETHVN